MKFKTEFNETFNDEVTSLQFSTKKPTSLLACSLEGMIAYFDLDQNNEEDSTISSNWFYSKISHKV